jgi:hypothetical protein
MLQQHVVVGCMIVALCGLIVVNSRLFLEKTKKGQRLVGRFGPDRAPWVLRGLAATGAVFGALLAMGIIRPVQW